MLEQKAALDFVNFVKSDAAKAIFDSYYFDTDSRVKRGTIWKK